MEQPKATRTNIFLTDEDRALVALIQREHGLTTASSAIRIAIREAARKLERQRRAAARAGEGE